MKILPYNSLLSCYYFLSKTALFIFMLGITCSCTEKARVQDERPDFPLSEDIVNFPSKWAEKCNKIEVYLNPKIKRKERMCMTLNEIYNKNIKCYTTEDKNEAQIILRILRKDMIGGNSRKYPDLNLKLLTFHFVFSFEGINRKAYIAVYVPVEQAGYPAQTQSRSDAGGIGLCPDFNEILKIIFASSKT